MSKLLDLDAIAPPPRRIKIGGREYDLAPYTFDTFFALHKAKADLKNITEGSMQDATLALARVVVPEADDFLRGKLDPKWKTFTAICDFWAGSEDDEAAALAQANPPPPG